MNTLVRVQGYASLFGAKDLVGDVVHAGAFARSLTRRPQAPMLLEHAPRLVAGVWDAMEEDSRGLFVHGAIRADQAAGGLALRRIQAGVDGLSIGYRTVRSRRREGQGRDLFELDLIEISIVRAPMLPAARLQCSALSLAATKKEFAL